LLLGSIYHPIQKLPGQNHKQQSAEEKKQSRTMPENGSI
jgi:hypothetical protein